MQLWGDCLPAPPGKSGAQKGHRRTPLPPTNTKRPQERPGGKHGAPMSRALAESTWSNAELEEAAKARRSTRSCALPVAPPTRSRALPAAPAPWRSPGGSCCACRGRPAGRGSCSAVGSGQGRGATRPHTAPEELPLLLRPGGQPPAGRLAAPRAPSGPPPFHPPGPPRRLGLAGPLAGARGSAAGF